MSNPRGSTDRIDTLAAYWDGAPVDGEPSPAPDEIATIAALRARLPIARPPASFVSALEARLLATPHAVPAKSYPRLGVSSRTFLHLASLLLFVVALVGGAIVLGNRAGAPPATVEAPNQTSVWVSTAAGDDLVELDPNTLSAESNESAALAAMPAIALSWPYPRLLTYLSADGSTMVRLTQPDLDAGVDTEYRFECFDAVDGALRAAITQSFASVTLLETPLLSPDGARLIVRSEGSNEGIRDGGPPSWSVYDTATGLLVSTIYPRDAAGGMPMFDPLGKRLYRLVTHWDESGKSGAVPPQELVAYDLDAGSETTRTPLPPIETAGITAAVAAATPAADGAALLLTYVDAGGELRAIRELALPSFALGNPTPLIAAQTTSATPPTSAATERPWNALGNLVTVSSAGGETLFVLRRVDIDAAHDFGGHRMAAINLRSGHIEHQQTLTDAPGVLSGMKLYQPVFRPSPDGASIYVAGIATVSEPDGRTRWVVQRRDATTFDLLAEQTFVEYRSVLVA